MFQSLYQWIRRIIAYFFGQRWVRFGIVGVAATITYFILALLFEHAGLPIFVGNTLSYVLGFGVSYTGHRTWTFQSTGSHSSLLPKFMATQAFGLGLNSAIIWVLMHYGLPYIFAMPIAIVTVPVAVYIISKVWVFRDPAAYVPKVPRAPATEGTATAEGTPHSSPAANTDAAPGNDTTTPAQEIK